MIFGWKWAEAEPGAQQPELVTSDIVNRHPAPGATAAAAQNLKVE